MAENHGSAEIAPIPKTADIMQSPLFKEFALPMLKNALKKEMGIGTSEKAVTNKPFGRALYAIRDVWHGIWWTIPALMLTVGITWLILLAFRKFLGV